MNTIMAASFNFANSWTTTWNSVSGPISGLTSLLSILGMLLIVGAIVKYFWDRRKGGGDHMKLLWVLLLGMVLAGPDIIIPVILTIVDQVASGIAGLLHNSSGAAGSSGTTGVTGVTGTTGLG